MQGINKKCGNCGKYPFCKRTNGATDCCNEWIKRKVGVENGTETIKSNRTIK